MVLKYLITFIPILISYILFYFYQTNAPHFASQKVNNWNNSYFVTPDFLSKEDFQIAVNFTKNIDYFLNIRESTLREDYYGATDPESDGSCKYFYQILNKNKTKCLILGRFDFFYHFFITGGYEGKKIYPSNLISKHAMGFQRLFHSRRNNESDVYIFNKLFQSEVFKNNARKICPGKELFDPIQGSFQVTYPQQLGPIHYDASWFIGGDRFTLPGWLTVVMKMSGLYKEFEVPQIQGILYVHEWTDQEVGKGGFMFWPKGPGAPKTTIIARPNQATIVDGSSVPHGIENMRPGINYNLQLNKDLEYMLRYNKNTTLYDIINKNDSSVVISIPSENIRNSLVWRVRCFKDEEEKKLFNEKFENGGFKLEDIVDKHIDDLIKRGKIKERPKTEFEIVYTLFKNYIHYPFPESYFPYNYCLLFESYFPKWMKPLGDLLCE